MWLLICQVWQKSLSFLFIKGMNYLFEIRFQGYVATGGDWVNKNPLYLKKCFTKQKAVLRKYLKSFYMVCLSNLN